MRGGCPSPAGGCWDVVFIRQCRRSGQCVEAHRDVSVELEAVYMEEGRGTGRGLFVSIPELALFVRRCWLLRMTKSDSGA